MTEAEVIAIALDALNRDGTRIGNGPVRAFRYTFLQLGGSGWLVHVPLDVPESFEPNSLSVEVYEPDGRVNIPPVL